MEINDVFVKHLIDHLVELGYKQEIAEQKLCCQICGKTINKIFEEKNNQVIE